MDAPEQESVTSSYWGTFLDMPRQPDDVRSPRDIVAKVLLGGERKFLEPLMPFAHGDVRDHIG